MADPNQVTRIKILGGTSAQRLAFIPLRGELIQDTQSNYLYIGDGVTAGGVLAAPLAAVADRIATVVKNESGATIVKGSPLYVVGNSAGMVLVEAARADDPAKSGVTFVADSDISNNSTGIAVIAGIINNINLTGFVEGGSVYLAPTGGLTQTRPVEPNDITHIGDVVKAGASGILEVQIMHPLEFANLAADHVPIGVAGGNTTTTNLFNAIRGTLLTGVSFAIGGAIVATDTILGAFGKLQKQISDNLSTLSGHIADTANPHATTKAQVGLSNVPNIDTSTTSNISEGSNLFFTTARVLATALTGLSITGGAVISTDTVLAAFGKLQNQINNILSTALTGFVASTNTAIAATDTILQALQKAQGQINARALTSITISAGTSLNGGGDLSANRTINHNSFGAAGTYGSASSVPVFTTEATGHVSGVTNTPIAIVAAAVTDFAAAVRAVVLTGLTIPYDTAVTAADSILTAIGKLQGQIDVWTELVKTSADQIVNSNVTLTTVTDLDFPVVAGRTYYIEYTLRFRTAATTTGIGLTIANLNTAAGELNTQVNLPIAADGTAALYTGSMTALGDIVTSTGVQAATPETYIANIKGVFVCTASGDIGVQFRSEVNGSNVNIRQGSVGLIREFQ